MKTNNKNSPTYDKLKTERDELNEQLQKLEEESVEIEKKEAKRRDEFERARKSTLLAMLNPTQVKKSLRTLGAYVLGRRNRKRLYSTAYKKKQASNDVKGLVYALYEDGFTERALSDIKEICHLSNDRYVKRAAAWELALWYANKQTKEAAEMALSYIELAKEKETDPDKRRRIAIVEAECLLAIGDRKSAQQRLHAQLQRHIHPDLYLALANVATEVEQKTYWINKTFEHFTRQPIYFSSHDATEVTYDHLQTTLTDAIDGPKVSVILPAYNSEKGIATAIDSILTQTWHNIELLIVDDCSTDRTFDVIKRYAEQDDRIRIFQTEENSGPYVARNIALEHATGDFVTVNDADDWSHAEKIAIQVAHLLENEHVIANTSEQARLTDDLQFYRRGTRGKYIFSNMSSLMFRRQEVLDTIGYWDEVRFAADGEFKRRLIKTFGSERVIDLQTGPLSFPRQSSSSLTGSSAFGYNGHFFGARKEYFESFSTYHHEHADLYYERNAKERPFPVPQPMLPQRIKGETNHVDVVIVANFYNLSEEEAERIIEKLDVHEKLGLTTGLVQLKPYDLRRGRTTHPVIRQRIDGKAVRRLVYGEIVSTNLVIVSSIASLADVQQFVPEISTKGTLIIIDEIGKMTYNSTIGLNRTLRELVHQTMDYFDRRGRWYPLNEDVRKRLYSTRKKELTYISLATDNWVKENERFQDTYKERIRPWMTKVETS